MNSFLAYLRSTIGMKKLVGISGLAIAGFCLTHMAGNLLLLVGPEAYNNYSHKLTSTPLIYVAEAGLIALFVMHVGLVMKLAAMNRSARESTMNRYAVSAKGDKATCWIKRTLILSGLLIFTFVVLHLITFKYGEVYTATYNGVEMRDLYKLVEEKFHEPLYVAWYIVSLVVLGLHLSHGISASFQSLGVASANCNRLRKIAIAFTVIVIGGFIAQPLYFFFQGA